MRDPFLLDAGKALSTPGVRHSHRVTGRLGDVGLPSARLAEGSEVDVDVVVEAQGSTVTVEGTAHALWTGECRRCLEMTDGHLEVGLREVFSRDPVEGETFPLEDDDRLDLRPMLREVLTLAMPLAPLCSPTCAGPAPEAHPVGHANGDVREDETGDDVWAALDQLRLDR